MSANGLFLAGKVYLKTLPADGSDAGFFGPVNATKLEINPGDGQTFNRISTEPNDYGQVKDSVVVPGQPVLNLDFNRADAAALAYALLGGLSTVTQADQTAREDTVTAILGQWRKLTYRNLKSAGLTVKSDDGSTTYVLGTDYQIDYAGGLVQPLQGGSIGAGDNIKVTYDAAAITGTKITGGQKPFIPTQLYLDGINMATQKAVELMIHRAILIPTGAVGFMQQDYVVTGLSGNLVTPDGQAGPFSYVEYEAAPFKAMMMPGVANTLAEAAIKNGAPVDIKTVEKSVPVKKTT